MMNNEKEYKPGDLIKIKKYGAHVFLHPSNKKRIFTYGYNKYFLILKKYYDYDHYRYKMLHKNKIYSCSLERLKTHSEKII